MNTLDRNHSNYTNYNNSTVANNVGMHTGDQLLLTERTEKVSIVWPDTNAPQPGNSSENSCTNISANGRIQRHHTSSGETPLDHQTDNHHIYNINNIRPGDPWQLRASFLPEISSSLGADDVPVLHTLLYSTLQIVSLLAMTSQRSKDMPTTRIWSN